jgi:hypothetical protein
MQPFSAIVKNGRLTLDEPCTFTEGEVVILLPLNELLAANGHDGDEDISFEIASAFARPQWRKPEAMDAAALIKELRKI